MSQQNRRFTSARFKDSSDRANAQNPSTANPLPIIDLNTSKTEVNPASTLLQVPPNYQPQDLTVRIDPDGRKKFVNSSGVQSIIYPFRNKFFGDFNRKGNDIVGVHNRLASIDTIKKAYNLNFNVNYDSKIYNYALFDIHLIGQYYQNMVDEKQKKKMSNEFYQLKGNYNWIKRVVLGYSIFLIVTRRMKWSNLTSNNLLRLNFYVIGGMLWAKAYLELQAFPSQSILKNKNIYEHLLETYENDYKIVY